jgi:putative molybdopterin biosynthesis protein
MNEHAKDDCCDDEAPAKPSLPILKLGKAKPPEARRHFLAVVSKEEAERTWRAALAPEPLGVEDVPLEDALGRTLGADVTAAIDLPPFDRAVVDGFAVIASDTFVAGDAREVTLRLAGAAVAAGDDGRAVQVSPGTAVEVATGAPLPRGANAVVMVENVEREPGAVRVGRAVVPGEGIQFTGVDLRRGETIFRRGERLGARETGVLAGQGLGQVPCFKRPRVAVISTGDELVAPGAGPLRLGQIYDSNARIVCDLVRENGGVASNLGFARDTREALVALLEKARSFDAIVLSGGTSKGAGDLTYKLVDELGKPGILVHGVAVKPGKPTVLAAWGRKPVVILPGFPTSAAITFDVFVKPVIRILAGLDAVEPRDRREATLAVSMPAGGGRHEYVLCNLVRSGDGLVAYPIIKGSGSVAAFAQADGFFEVPPNRDRAEKGERYQVTLVNADRREADLVVVGASCPLLDRILGIARERLGLRSKVVGVGSKAGLEAAARGEADLAPVNLLGADGVYNESFARGLGLGLVRGYARKQGLALRPGLGLAGSPEEIVVRARERGLRLMNRNGGSGTRVLIDGLLERAAGATGAADRRAWAVGFPGYDVLARSHQGACGAVASGNADWTVAIESCARDAGLSFVGLRLEELDFAVPPGRLASGPVAAFVRLLASEEVRALVEATPGFASVTGAGGLRLAEKVNPRPRPD